MLTYTQRDLYDIPPMEHPKNMAIVLYNHQLKGVAQMHFLCNSTFRGGVLADGIGVGKTHSAISAMFLVKDDPGFSLVVAPKTLCLQWVAAIKGC
jgi:SNF2 family DNA or RNA helicase